VTHDPRKNSTARYRKYILFISSDEFFCRLVSWNKEHLRLQPYLWVISDEFSIRLGLGYEQNKFVFLYFYDVIICILQY